MHSEKTFFGTLKPNNTTLDEESVHHIRKETKKLRALLHLHKLLEGEQKTTEQLRQSVKLLARMLAGQRDSDVMDALLQDFLIRTTDPELAVLMTQLQQQLKHEELSLSGTQEIIKLAGEIEKHAHKKLSSLPDDKTITPFLATQLNILCKKGHDLLYADTMDWEVLHNWRKRVKRLMYQYKLKTKNTPGDLYTVELLEALGDLLGRINDLNILGNLALRQEMQCTRARTLLTYEKLHALLNRHKQDLLIQSRLLLEKLEVQS